MYKNLQEAWCNFAIIFCGHSKVLSDVVEATSTRRRRRKKLRLVDVKTAASSSTENVKKVDELSIKILPIYLQAAAITNAEILVAYF